MPSLHKERRPYEDSVLDVYLLPRLEWTVVQSLQQRLIYDMGEHPRRRAALMLCEHDPVITVGRQGSYRHLWNRQESDDPERELHWTNRGGGCWLQTPGQLALYAIAPVGEPGPNVFRFRELLYQTLFDVLEELGLNAERDRQAGGIVVGGREIASVGLAVKNNVVYHGARLNVCVDLDLYDSVQSNPLVERKMTSMFRELRAPLRINQVKESVVHHFARVFGFQEHFLCSPPSGTTTTRRPANVGTGHH